MPTTPIPNSFIDQHLPRLKDTEARILLVVLRSTAGWVTKEGERKKRDWITHRQFQVRTGRTGEAVSVAIDSLVRQGFLEAHDAFGRLLRSPRTRKSQFGKIYYSAGPLLWNSQDKPNPDFRVGKAETTKASKNKRKLNKEVTQTKGSRRALGTEHRRQSHPGWQQAGTVARTRWEEHHETP